MENQTTPSGGLPINMNVSPFPAPTSTPFPTLSTQTAPAPQPTTTTTAPAQSGLGAYKGVVITPGSDAEIAAQIQKINAAQPGYDPAKITNPTGPSSSSTVTTNNGVQTDTSSATNTANGVKAPLSDLQSKIISTYGFDESYVRGLSSDAQAQFALSLRAEDVATQQSNQAKADQDNMYRASLAEQNSEYAAARAELAASRQKDLDTAKTTAASLNPYSGANTDEDNYKGSINHEYDKLETQLMNSAEQAKAALASGNYAAYAKINSSMAQIKANGIANIQSMLSDLKKSDQQQQQFEQTFKLNEETKNTTLFQSALQNLPQPKDLAGLPDSLEKMTPEQRKNIEGQEAYEVGIKAGLSPQAAWSGIKNAATSAYKQQSADTALQNANTSAARAQAYMLTAQANLANKQAGAIDAQTVAGTANGAFLSAFQNAQASGKYTKDKNTTTLSTLAYNLQNGDTTNAKTALVNYTLSGGSATDVRMYQTLQGLPEIINSLKTKINALPKDQKQAFLTGTFQEINQKFGQNPNPQLSTLVAEFGHLQKNYVAPIYGMRAAASTGDSIFNNLFPSGTDSKSLSLSKLDALVNTAQDTINSQVQSRIGSEPYSAIFGTAGALNPKGSVSNLGTWQGLTVGQDMVNQKDGKTYTITATGPVLKK